MLTWNKEKVDAFMNFIGLVLLQLALNGMEKNDENNEAARRFYDIYNRLIKLKL